MAVELDYDYDKTTAEMEKFSQKDIDDLKKWTQTLDISKCVPKDLSDKQLVFFYNACEGDLGKTKICIEKYYSVRKSAPEFFDNRVLTSADLKDSVEALEFTFLPNRSPEGYDIVFHRLHYTEPSKYNLDAGIKLLIMTMDACLYHRGPQRGVICLFDMRGVRLTHLTRLSMGSLKKFFTYLQEALPLQLKAIHVMNAASFFDKVLAILRPFMDKKLLGMINLHTSTEDMEKFYKTVLPRSALLPDYGGELPDSQTLHHKCMEQLRELEPYYRAEEAQRKAALPNKGKSNCIDTNFKKLEID